MEKQSRSKNQLPHQEKESNLEQFSGVYEQGIEQLRAIKTKYGVVSLASDIGIGNHRNEDRVLMDTTRNLFGVVDGMGGYAHGDQAAQIVAEEVVQGVRAGIRPAVIQFEASSRMKQKGIFMGGACYCYFQIEKKTLTIIWAGDVKLIVLNSGGEIKYETQSTNLDKAPRGQSMGNPSSDIIEITNYDTVIVASDGLWDNFPLEDLRVYIEEIKSGETDVLAKKLFSLAKQGMEQGFMTNYNGLTPDRRKDFGKPDNVSIVVFQKLPTNI